MREIKTKIAAEAKELDGLRTEVTNMKKEIPDMFSCYRTRSLQIDGNVTYDGCSVDETHG